jgi:hypothetical protein
MVVTSTSDGYRTRRELEERIRQLRVHLWSDPGDRREIEGMIEAAELELRKLDNKESTS